MPAFTDTPLIFQRNGDCGITGCRKAPHFRRADLYVRSTAMESRRVEDPAEMRHIIQTAARSMRDDSISSLRAEFGMMMAEVRGVISQAPAFSYLPGDALTPQTAPNVPDRAPVDGDFFSAFFFPWLMNHGHFDLTVTPTTKPVESLPLEDVPQILRGFAVVHNRNGILVSAPYETTNQVEHFQEGARLKGRRPEWHRVEADSLSTASAYRIVRSFPEDFEPTDDRKSARMQDSDPMLWIDTFVESVTLFYELAGVVALNRVGANGTARVRIAVDGLANRRITANDVQENLALTPRYHGLSSSVNQHVFDEIVPVDELVASCRKLAAAFCKKVLWFYGITDDIVPLLQNSFVPPR